MTDNISQWLQHTCSLTCSNKVYILPEGAEHIFVHFQIMIQFCFHTHVFNVYSTYNYSKEKKTALITITVFLGSIHIDYRWLILWEWISHTNITSKVKHEMWNAMRNPFHAKYISNNMFIKDLSKCCQCNITVEHQWSFFRSHLL